MFWAVNLILLIAAAAVCLPIGMFCLEVFLSLFPRRQPPEVSGNLKSQISNLKSSSLAILIPAHNEALVLGRTLQTLIPTLPPASRVVVVADNCTDATAEIARQHGAEGVERRSEQRGKGYALQFGLTYLAQNPPAAVVFLDADCQVYEHTVRLLGQATLATGRPVQGLNLCDPDPCGGPLQAVSALAFRFKNLVRMMGLSRLAGLCYLTGTGMALPWPLLGKVRLDGNVVEDMQWGIDLALAGHATLFLPEARVNSPLPQTQRAAGTQRTRWEHGHLSTLLSQVPRLLCLAARHRRWGLLCLACDLAIPPLSLLVLIYAAMLLLTTAAALLTAQTAPALILCTLAPCFLLALASGWYVHCRQVIPLGTLLAAPLYILKKLPIYGSFLWKRQRTWVRTERDLAPRT